MGHSKDRIHGGADLVAHVGEEVGLGLGGGHGLFFGGEEIRFGLLAIGDVFGCIEEILWIARGISNDGEGAVSNDEAAVTADKALLPFVSVALACEEFRISFCARGTLIGMDDLIPFPHGA